MLFAKKIRSYSGFSVRLMAVLAVSLIVPRDSNLFAQGRSATIDQVDSLSVTFADSAAVIERLKTYGIDYSNPGEAIERARKLGAPEQDIQRVVGNKDDKTVLRDKSDNGEKQQNELSGNSITDTALTTKQLSSSGDSSRTVRRYEETPPPPDKRMGAGRFAGLRYYGYDIFHAGEGAVGPIEVGPVDPEYPIGSGDVLRVTLWGEVEFQTEVTVSRDGTIVLPRAGQIFVAGTRLSQLRTTLGNYLSKFYSGLSQEPPTIFMDITLARLRSNQIYIMGEVDRPGAYAISSYATAFNAMYAIGGPKVTGSLREVRILREGKPVLAVDLYDYFLKGVSPSDQRLQMGDIVFIPPRITTVAIKGEVLRPGIYELKSNETVRDLIALAGGLKPDAYSFRIQVDRIIPFEERVKGQAEKRVLDIDIDSMNANKQAGKLVDGDVVSVFPIVDTMENYVDITGGGIRRPGRYELNESVRTIADVIRLADGLTDDAYTVKADLIRTKEDLTKEFVEIDLEAVLHGSVSSAIALQRWDILNIYSKRELDGLPQVILSGYVQFPGAYLLPENMTVYDLVFAHAGLQDSLRLAKTFMDRGDIYRLGSDGKTRHILPFNLKDVWERKAGATIPLRREDEIVLYSNEVQEYIDRTVGVHGAVKNPGTYAWEENLTLADILLKSGGFTQGAWFIEAEVARIPQSGIPGDTLAYTMLVPLLDAAHIPEDAESAIRSVLSGKTSASKYLLLPGDKIFIRINPDYNPITTVTVLGEVGFPGEYTLTKNNETLRELLARAGGVKNTGYTGGGKLTRNDRTLYIDFEKLLKTKDEIHDIILLPGDIVSIPAKPNTVEVKGEVYNPGLFKFRTGLRVTDYISLSGGRTENGGQVYITFPSGYTYRCGAFQNPKVEEGSVIQVISKKSEEAKEKTDWAGVVKETTAVISSVMMVIYLSQQVN